MNESINKIQNGTNIKQQVHCVSPDGHHTWKWDTTTAPTKFYCEICGLKT